MYIFPKIIYTFNVLLDKILCVSVHEVISHQEAPNVKNVGE